MKILLFTVVASLVYFTWQTIRSFQDAASYDPFEDLDWTEDE